MTARIASLQSPKPVVNTVDEMKIEHLRQCGWPEVATGIELLMAALKEIASDPTGISTYQAEIAKQALDGTYEPLNIHDGGDQPK